MRDKRFIAEHRGGPLKKEQHYMLIKWAYDSSKHVLHLYGRIDERLTNALIVAKKWQYGDISVGEARKVSLDAIAVANESSNLTKISVARSVGHAVATAHMADHSLGAALYALKAVKSAGGSIYREIQWQNNQIPIQIKELIVTARDAEKFRKI